MVDTSQLIAGDRVRHAEPEEARADQDVDDIKHGASLRARKAPIAQRIDCATLARIRTSADCAASGVTTASPVIRLRGHRYILHVSRSARKYMPHINLEAQREISASPSTQIGCSPSAGWRDEGGRFIEQHRSARALPTPEPVLPRSDPGQ